MLQHYGDINLSKVILVVQTKGLALIECLSFIYRFIGCDIDVDEDIYLTDFS